MNIEVQKLIDKAEKLGWDVENNEGEISFEIFDSSGGDFVVEFRFNGTVSDLIQKVESYYDNYDVNEEFDLYYEASKHGFGGVPEPEELMSAMKERKNLLKDLVDVFNNKGKINKLLKEV